MHCKVSKLFSYIHGHFRQVKNHTHVHENIQEKLKNFFYLRQYICNKPTKWGFKFWVLADGTGYMVDFNLYCGRKGTSTISPHGLSYDVVMELLAAYENQGYEVFVDNFYTSPKLFADLEVKGIRATGTLKVNCQGVPTTVKQLQTVLKSSTVPWGTGYYIREPGSSAVYICWRDNDCVTFMSTAYPGHQEGTTNQRGKYSGGRPSLVQVPLPSVVKNYNMYMGGVDKSDQLVSYHRIARQTKTYWKTIFYHLLEIAVTNAFVLHKLLLIKNGKATVTESTFQDSLILLIINNYRSFPTIQPPTSIRYRCFHGSVSIISKRCRCAICKSWSSRECRE